MLKVRSLNFAYLPGKRILTDVEIEMGLGESLLIIGGNGTGKTTFGRVLSGILDPNSGEIEINGQNPRSLAIPSRSKLVSYMSQVNHISIICSSISDEIMSFSQKRVSTSRQSFFRQWTTRHQIPQDYSTNPRDLPVPDLWRLMLGLHAIVLEPDLLIVDEVVGAGIDIQDNCVKEILEYRRARMKSTIFLYQRALSIPFDLTRRMVNRCIIA